MHKTTCYRRDKVFANTFYLIVAGRCILCTTHAQNSRRSIKHDEPWWLPPYHGRHGAPPWLRGIETSANTYNKAVSLKLDLLVYFLPLQRLRPRKTMHKTLTNQPPDALLNHGGRRRPMAALVPWCPPDFAEHRKNC